MIEFCFLTVKLNNCFYKGTFKYAKNKRGWYQYEGVWKEGWMEEEGRLYYENGEIFIGKLKNGVKDGKGTLIYDNNSTAAYYKGQFLNDMRYTNFSV